MKTEILYGLHPVLEAFKARRRDLYTLYMGKSLSEHRKHNLTALAQDQKVPVEIHPMERIQAIAHTDHHQGICARVSAFPMAGLDDLLVPRNEPSPFFLVIDSVVDPHNLGALIRTALAVGAQAVVVPKDRSAPASPSVSKASAGALEHTPLAQVTNLSRALDRLKKNGFWIFGLDAAAGQDLYETEMTGPVALVVGGEEKGIRPLVRKHCDLLVTIPQRGPLDSLNASVAGAVAMYEILRQQRTPPRK